MREVQQIPNGFVISGMSPEWIAKGSTLTAWYNSKGELIRSAVVTHFGFSREVDGALAIRNYLVNEGLQEHNRNQIRK